MVYADTDVMVDILREYEPATAWLSSLGDEPVMLSGFVVAELLQGCANKDEQAKVVDALAPYARVWPSSEICDRALSLFADSHLAHGLGIIDALIGQTAVDLQLTLNTFNKKHYQCIQDLYIEEPYERT